MFNYDQLDLIADSYIPLLFITSSLVLGAKVFKFGFKRSLTELGTLILAVILVYLIMAFDNVVSLWPFFNLDYSTHTALSLVFVMYLAAKSMSGFILSILSFVLYALLMVYQQYHTITDIVSTAVVLAPIIGGLMYGNAWLKWAKGRAL